MAACDGGSDIGGDGGSDSVASCDGGGSGGDSGSDSVASCDGGGDREASRDGGTDRDDVRDGSIGEVSNASVSTVSSWIVCDAMLGNGMGTEHAWRSNAS